MSFPLGQAGCIGPLYKGSEVVDFLCLVDAEYSHLHIVLLLDRHEGF